MDTQAYPGKGLSPMQLLFALNEELKRTAFSSPVTLDHISQLDRHTTAALATIHEWKNSFVPINRLPLDIFSLIPTYLPSEKDHFLASFVCRHWRRTFLQRAELWSELDLRKGEDYVKSLLERSKGSPLAIQVGRVARRKVPISTMALLSSHTSRIRVLGFVHHGWADIQEFVDTNPGPFPLLDSLAFDVAEEASLVGPDVVIPPSTHLFDTAVNLRVFRFHSGSGRSPPLSHFAFPNLVEFDFRMQQWAEDFHALQLLDFLEASPMLRTVCMKVIGIIWLDGIPQERVVILPNVKDLSVAVVGCGLGYDLATHVSCPSVASMSLALEEDSEDMVSEEIFPTPALWDVIVRQYTRSPLEEVTLELNDDIACVLTLRSSDAAVIKLGITISTYDDDKNEDQHEVFTGATSSILNHPQLANLKRFSICHSYDYLAPIPTPRTASQVGRLFKSLGPLDEFTIYRCDVQPYTRYFLDALRQADESVVFSPIKKLTVTLPMCSSAEAFTVAIVGLSRSRHMLGVPFEQVEVRAEGFPADVEEGLTPWVGKVEYCYEAPEYDD